MTRANLEILSMVTVLKFRSPVKTDHYKSESCNVFCLDCRWCNEHYEEFYRQEGYHNPDRNYFAGGAKKLASPQNEGERESTLADILDLLKLHDCRRVNLGVHVNCGKYGKRFETPDEEIYFFQQELLKARQALLDYLRGKNCEAQIHMYLLDWEGMHEVKGPAL